MSATPHNAAAEQAVIGAVMTDPSALDRIQLTPADFFETRHAVIFAAQQKAATTGAGTDPISLLQHLPADGMVDLVYLTACEQSVVSARNVVKHAQQVASTAQHRRLIAAADAALSIAQEAHDPAQLDRIETLFAALARGQDQRAPKRLGDLVLQRTAHYEAVEAGDVEPGWPTGIVSLDRMLCGGLRPGWVYVLAARPSVGKTSLAQSIGLRQAGDGRPTLLLSQEMPDVDLTDRALAWAGRIGVDRLQTGRIGDEGWGRISDGVEELQHLPYFIDDQPALRLLDIRTKARAVKGLKVLMIDYVQLCEGAGTGNRNSDIEEISRGIKRLAKEMGVAVVLLSQLNRDVEKRPGGRPRMSDLRDSGAIEQDTDVALLLSPVRQLEGGRRLICLDIGKNRQGPVGAVGLEFDGAIQRWSASSEDVNAKAPVGRGFE